MRRTTGRFLLVALVAAFALSALAGPASAKGKPVTITLACNSAAAGITAHVQITTGGISPINLGDPVDLSCTGAGPTTANAATVKGLSQSPGGFSYSYLYSANLNGPGGGGFGTDTRKSVTPIYDSTLVQIGALTVN